jgi:hypothetical protein
LIASTVSIVAPGGAATCAAPLVFQRTSTRPPAVSAHPMAALPSVEVKRAVLVVPTSSRRCSSRRTQRTAER